MPRNKISSHILDHLAQQRRVIVADWRFYVVYKAVARLFGYVPPGPTKVHQVIRELCGSHAIGPVEGVSGVFRITIPYASILPAPQEIVLQEANPAAVFSDFTAAAYHNLTNEIPNGIYLTASRGLSTRLPLGTSPEDWLDIPEPRRRTPRSIDETPVYWSQTKPEWDFGSAIGYCQGCPIYITDLERTLLDGLRCPGRSGDALEVLRMWKRAVTTVNLDTLIEYVSRFNQTLLRQRVGFLLEQLGSTHRILDEWATQSVRGSSARLIADRDFSPTFSKRWNLSINVPDAILSELREDS